MSEYLTHVVCADARIPDVETNVSVGAWFSKSDRNREPLSAVAVKMDSVNTVCFYYVRENMQYFSTQSAVCKCWQEIKLVSSAFDISVEGVFYFAEQFNIFSYLSMSFKCNLGN